MKMIAPRGWSAGTIARRFATVAPSSYDADSHSAECCISAGAPVKRIFGVEILEISRAAVDLSRIPVPLLDSHNQGSVVDNVLGRIESAWISGGELLGRIVFAQTPRGRTAEAMVGRGELSAISAGYQIQKWSAVDADGDEVDDPESARWDSDLVFTAVRWSLLEASLVGVPADAAAAVRSLPGGDDIDAIRSRMQVRARMAQRQRMYNAQQRAFGGHDDD
jgi:phage head maturation protease